MMNKAEKFKARLEELKKQGLSIDATRAVGSLKLASAFAFSAEPDKAPVLHFDEDEKYFYPTFRALSAFVIYERALDFSMDGVLKKSTKMMKGQTVYKDHNCSVDQWVGVTAKSIWDTSDHIPHGINVNLKLNKKWNERVIDGIKDGAIHSVSVNVLFEYQKSHPELEDFWYHLGEEIGGQLVRMIVTKIISYGEISLVWQGADIYAKRIDSFSTDSGNKGKGPNPEKVNQKQSQNGGDSVKLTKTFASLCMLNLAVYGLNAGVSEVELDDAGKTMLFSDLGKLFGEMKTNNQKLQTIFAGVLGDDVNPEEYEAKLKAMAVNAAHGDKYLNDIRQETLSFAKISEGKTDDEKFSESVMGKIILSADVESAVQLRDEFQKKAEEVAPLTCSSCGAKLTRASAKKTDDKTDDGIEEINTDNYQY